MKADACSCIFSPSGCLSVDPECPRHGWMCEDGRTLTGPQLLALRLLSDAPADIVDVRERTGASPRELEALTDLGWNSIALYWVRITEAGREALKRFGAGRVV